MKLPSLLYRSNLVFNCIVCIDRSKNVLKIEEDVYYRAYRVDGKFGRLLMGFEDEKSEHISSKIMARDLTDEFTQKDVIDNEENPDQTMSKTQRIEIPEKYSKFDYIDIHRKFIEYGGDHWLLFSYKAPSPTDGITLNIRCKDNIEVRSYNRYGTPVHCDIENNKDNITIKCNDWLDPGFGLTVLFAINNNNSDVGKVDPPEIEADEEKV